MALDLHGVIHRFYRQLGGAPFAVSPFVDLVFRDGFIDSPEGNAFLQITDPMSYAQRYANISKLIVSGASDEYFPPDHTDLWFSRMPGPKVNLIVPNVGHLVGGEQLLSLAPTVAAFVRGVLQTEARVESPGGANAQDGLPELRWRKDNATGAIIVWQVQGPAPVTVELWQASTCDGTRRDFRLHNNDKGERCSKCGVDHRGPLGIVSDPFSVTFGGCKNTAVAWSSSPLAEAQTHGADSGVSMLPAGATRLWEAEVPAPDDGRWAAFFVQFEFLGPDPPAGLPRSRHTMSTEVSVVPDTDPFPDCPTSGCSDVDLVFLGVNGRPQGSRP